MTEMKRITLEEYRTYTKTRSKIFYNTAEFLELNRDKTGEIVCTAAIDGNTPRFVFAFGLRDSTASSPFSAPFAMPVSLKARPGLEHYDEALDSLEDFARRNHWRHIRFTLPPMFYFREELTGWLNSFYRKGWSVGNIDINYALDLGIMHSESYIEDIMYNARRNLNIAMKSRLELIPCRDEYDSRRAYSVIAVNRAGKGYPLRMSYEQVRSTVQLVDHEMFIVKHGDDDIAAALVYRVRPDTAQVIYWGDKLEFRSFKPINYLSYQLIQFYGERGFKWLDIGPSTEDSVPNYGLCEFKESIGCERDLKYTVYKEIEE